MQKLVNEFTNKYKLQTDINTRYIDLVSEIGELGKEIIKSTDYGKKNFTPTGQLIDEVGDCVFSMLALCSQLNIDAQEALLKSLTKYEHRFDNKGHISSDEI